MAVSRVSCVLGWSHEWAEQINKLCVSLAAVKCREQQSQQVLSAGAASSDFEAPSPPPATLFESLICWIQCLVFAVAERAEHTLATTLGLICWFVILGGVSPGSSSSNHRCSARYSQHLVSLIVIVTFILYQQFFSPQLPKCSCAIIR